MPESTTGLSDTRMQEYEAAFNGTAEDFDTMTQYRLHYQMIVGSTAYDPSLNGTVGWYINSLGVNFLGINLTYFAPANNFGRGTYNTLYF
jgi:hypothetical protein